jgi:hypothetical protein
MRLYDIVSGILLIIPTVNSAVAMPVPRQEKRQPAIDMELIPADTITMMLGKRFDDFDELSKLILGYGHNPDLVHENPFARPEEPSAARPSSSLSPSMPFRTRPFRTRPLRTRPFRRPNVGWTNAKKMLPSIPEDPAAEDEAMKELAPGKSSPASLTMSDAHPGSVGAHALPNPGPSTESDHLLTGMGAPLSSPVYPTWFSPNRGSMGAHAPQPNLGPNSRPSTEFDSDHRLVVEEPPSGPGSSTVADDHEYHVVHPPSPSPGLASSTKFDRAHAYEDMPDRRSMVADSPLENLQAVSDPLKDNATESRRIYGAAGADAA